MDETLNEYLNSKEAQLREDDSLVLDELVNLLDSEGLLDLVDALESEDHEMSLRHVEDLQCNLFSPEDLFDHE